MSANLIVKCLEADVCICFVYRLNQIRHARIDVTRMEDIWHVNRIIVPQGFRRKGIGTALMDDLIQWADSKQITLALGISSYGDMSNDQLEQWYKKYGFVYQEGNTILVRKAGRE